MLAFVVAMAFRLLQFQAFAFPAVGDSLSLAVQLLATGMVRDLAPALLVFVVMLVLLRMPSAWPARVFGALVLALLLGLYAADTIFLRYNTRRLGFELFTIDSSVAGAAVGVGLAEARGFILLCLLLMLACASIILIWPSRRSRETNQPIRTESDGDAPSTGSSWLVRWWRKIPRWLTVGSLTVLSMGAHLVSVESRSGSVVLSELEQSLPVSLLVSRLQMALVPKYIPKEEAANLVSSMMQEPHAVALDGDAFYKTRQPSRTLPARIRNVVVLLLEGVAAAEINPDTAPQLARVASAGTVFSNFYANGLRTRNGLVATVTGWPDIVDYSAVRTYAAFHRFSSLAELMRGQQFAPVFVYGGDASFEGYDRFLRLRGFSRIVDKSQLSARYPNEPRTAFGDAFHDDILLTEVARIVSGEGRHFVMALGLSTHAPFLLPLGFQASSGDRYDRYLATLRFTDQAIGRFVARMRASEWGRDTVLVITSDHSHHIRQSRLDNFHIPLIWIGPGFAPQRLERIGSQVDLLPTFQALLGGRSAQVSAGRDLFDDSVQNDFAFLSAGRGIALVERCGAVFVRPGQSRIFFQARVAAAAAQRDCASGTDRAGSARRLLAYFQTTRDRLLRNRVVGVDSSGR